MPRQVGETPGVSFGYAVASPPSLKLPPSLASYGGQDGAARVGAARDGGAGREHRENHWHGLHGKEEEYRIRETE